MIEIDNILVSDDVVKAQFVCDLIKCKGGCCEDGDAGAPLSKEETQILEDNYEILKPYLTKEGMDEIEKKGKYYYDRSFGWVTPTIDGKICAYGYYDNKGIIKCGIEQAYLDGKISWKKPLTCHLYPIKTKKTKTYELVNYEPRETLCSPACKLGKKLQVPVYVFLKEALIRKYGEEFYTLLEQIANQYYKDGE
ncbi:MAG: DUF3109 family protein [Terrimonas sp.]|uniref:DUF3109 family protein n=1 Tax=Terrimonas sp. TaxID=1914338 RepID=UPI000928E4B0|nr:DUF3109 family protein [Terrimonas sp.]MBN8787810.1 DUF3109 family protein [Terrimonas sp.]OJY82560.1 MAG: hypothetical protein BGP13_25480 [Sphingobacteriales bacterium 40-81]PVD51579.1 DUF3109 domain-containing protein [Terrimonas sp.]